MDAKTIRVEQYRQAAMHPASADANTYAGHRIHALPGLHDFLGQLAARFYAPGARVLDLAAGSGAMCRRLQDLGYAPTAVDYVTENFKADDIPFFQADLNDDFADDLPSPGFDAVMASEIIEHLENPRHFLRQCFKLLLPGGRIIISTPNVLNPGSLAAFLRTGQFLWFSDRNYHVQGHISPLSHWQLDLCFAEAGFTVLWRGSFGEGASLMAGSPRLAMLARLISLVMTTARDARGEIYVCVAAKPAPAN